MDQKPRTLLNMSFPQNTWEKHRWFCLLTNPQINKHRSACCGLPRTNHTIAWNTPARGVVCVAWVGDCHLNWIELAVLFPKRNTVENSFFGEWSSAKKMRLILINTVRAFQNVACAEYTYEMWHFSTWLPGLWASPRTCRTWALCPLKCRIRCQKNAR